MTYDYSVKSNIRNKLSYMYDFYLKDSEKIDPTRYILTRDDNSGKHIKTFGDRIKLVINDHSVQTENRMNLVFFYVFVHKIRNNGHICSV